MIKIIKNIDKKLLFLSVILFAFGLVMVYSASNVQAYMFDAAPSRYFFKQLLFILSGVVAACFIIKFKTKSYSLFSWVAIIGLAVTILCLVIYGHATNGAYNWIGYKGFGIQPSEFAKVFIIPLLATYYEANIKNNDDFKKMYFPLLIVGIITFFIILQSDYGTALIFLALSIIIFFMAPVSKKLKKIVFFTGLGAVLILAVAIIFGGDKIIPKEKLERFNYFDPCSRYLTGGNQVCNGYIAINGGGFFGKGLGNSTQKYLYLPEAHTDFIFAIISEELGIVGGLVLFALYILLILRIIVIGKKSYKISHTLMCYGVSIYLFLHIVINLGGVMGLIPITGIPLPFMSYGGSFCWSTILALTFVQRVAYETNKKNKVMA